MPKGIDLDKFTIDDALVLLGEKMKDFPISEIPKPKRPKTSKKVKATKTKTKQNI